MTPQFASIDDWTKLSGVKRSTTYNLLAEGKLTARKLGGRTLIDVTAGLAFLASLPVAKINATTRRAA